MDVWLLSSCLFWLPAWTPVCSSSVTLIPDQWRRVVCLSSSPTPDLTSQRTERNSQAPVTATPLYALALRETRCLLLYCLVRTAQFVVSFDNCSWNVDMSVTSKGQAEQLLFLVSLLSAPLYLHLRVCCFAFILYKLVPPRIWVREKEPNFCFETLNKVLKHDKTIWVSVKRTCFSLSLGSRV